MHVGLAASIVAIGLGITTPTRTQILSVADRVHESPLAFAGRLAGLYAPSSKWWRTASPARDEAYRRQVQTAFLEPGFVKLMDDNGALAGARGGGPDLDYDPLCQCQDAPEDLHVVSAARRGAAAAIVSMKVACGGPNGCTMFDIALRRGRHGWRVHDVMERAGSVRARLIRHNACLRAARTEAAAEACLA